MLSPDGCIRAAKCLSVLRGVRLGGISPSHPRLFPNHGSAPTTLAETWREPHGLGKQPDGDLSRRSPETN